MPNPNPAFDQQGQPHFDPAAQPHFDPAAARRRRMQIYIALAVALIVLFMAAAALKNTHRTRSSAIANSAAAASAPADRRAVEFTEGMVAGRTRTLVVHAIDDLSPLRFIARMDEDLATWLRAHPTCDVQTVSILPRAPYSYAAYITCTCGDR